MNLQIVMLVLFAYFCGSIPFGKLVGKYYGIDIQKHGSGNIGVANVVRVLGWKPGLIVLIGDVGKGLIPVLIASRYLNDYQVLAAAVAAVAGHIFPIWLQFRGGKGIATGLGVTIVISPILGLFGLLIYLLSFAKFRKSAPSSLMAIWCLPLICLISLRQFALFYVSLALLATWAHRNNIREMIRETVPVE